MAKIDTYNLSTLLSFEYEAVLLSKNMAISIMMPLFLAIFTVLHQNEEALKFILSKKVIVLVSESVTFLQVSNAILLRYFIFYNHYTYRIENFKEVEKAWITNSSRLSLLLLWSRKYKLESTYESQYLFFSLHRLVPGLSLPRKRSRMQCQCKTCHPLSRFPLW